MQKSKQLTTEDIQKILKGINYPGFSRDIVSFGMVKSISLTESGADITLHINTDNADTLNQLDSTIREKLSSAGIASINLNIYKPSAQPAQQQAVQPKPIPQVKHVRQKKLNEHFWP